MNKNIEKLLNNHLEKLACELAEDLEEDSGIEYVCIGTEVKPKDLQSARIKEFGSLTLAKSPESFFDKTIKKWAKRNNIKGL